MECEGKKPKKKNSFRDRISDAKILWLRRGYLKWETESILMVALHNTIRADHIKIILFKIVNIDHGQIEIILSNRKCIK